MILGDDLNLTEGEATLQVLKALKNDFACYEEVVLFNSSLNVKLRADIVAIPLNKDYEDITLAFEIKSFASFRRGIYTNHLKQAADYVYTIIEDKALPENLQERMINSCFLYPAPSDQRPEDAFFKGAEHMAGKFGVGTLHINKVNGITVLKMLNPIWESDRGFFHLAKGILNGKRRVGSGKVDLFKK